MGWSAADIPNQQGRIALITGANSGVGLAGAKLLTAAGHKVTLACRTQAKADAAAAAPLVEFCSGLQWEGYKRMVLALEARLGPTLFDKDFTLDELKAAAAAE